VKPSKIRILNLSKLPLKAKISVGPVIVLFILALCLLLLYISRLINLTDKCEIQRVEKENQIFSFKV
jgi:hypothetical protein